MQKQLQLLLNCTKSMSLIDLTISATEEPLPKDVESLLTDALSRIERLIELQRDDPIFAYVPSDFVGSLSRSGADSGVKPCDRTTIRRVGKWRWCDRLSGIDAGFRFGWD